MYSLNGLLGPEGSFSFAEDSTGRLNTFFPKEDESYYNNTYAVSLAERMEEDKLFHLNIDEDDSFLEASSNMRDLIEMSHVEEVSQPERIFCIKEDSQELDHQKLIDEMEAFLQSHETGTQAEDNMPAEVNECPVLNEKFDDNDLMESDELLDSLLSELSEVDGFDINSLTEENFSIQEEMDSGVGNDLNVTVEEGSNVIFVITPSYEEALVSSPASSDDTDWSPVSSVKSSGKIRKKPYGPRRSKLGLQDKKERKKLQNVEAARRYRDKKKTEQQLMDEEVDELTKRNQELKGMVAEKENEVKTLKKLLQEIGLVSFTSMTA